MRYAFKPTESKKTYTVTLFVNLRYRNIFTLTDYCTSATVNELILKVLLLFMGDYVQDIMKKDIRYEAKKQDATF